MTHFRICTQRWQRPLALALNLASVTVLGLSAGACGPPTPQSRPPSLVADPPPSDDGALPGAGVADFDRGKAMIEQEAYAEAIAHFDRSLEAQPKNAEATYYRALAHDKLGKREEAIAGYEKAIELDKTLTNARVNLGAIYLDEPAQPEKAILVLAPAAKQEPKERDIRENLAYAYALAGQTEKSVAEYDAALAIKPDPRIHLAYAEMLFGAERQADAAKQYALALPGFSTDLKHTAYIAHRLAKSKAYEDCVVAFAAAIKLKADEPAFHLHRGLCHHSLDKEEEARADYQRAIEVNPKFQPAHYYMGMSYAGTKARGRAMLALRKAAEIDPKSPVGKKALEQLKKLK